MNCLYCDKPLNKKQIYNFNKGTSKGCCSSSCAQKNFNLKRGVPETSSKECNVCGTKFYGKPWYLNKVKVCSTRCSGILSSNRMTIDNPMKNQSTRNKVSHTLRSKGYKPKIRGGNGTGLTKTENILFLKLKKFGFIAPCNVNTVIKVTKYGKLPNHYKIDIGSYEHMIAIEVDGYSHKATKRKYQDLKKTDFLCSQKWKVLRFTNQQVIKDLSGCLKQVLSLI